MGANDALEQLQACQAQSVIDERRIAELEAEVRSLRGEATRMTDLVGMPWRETTLVLTQRQVAAVLAAEVRQDRAFADLKRRVDGGVLVAPDEVPIVREWIESADFEGHVAVEHIALAERFGAEVTWARMDERRERLQREEGGQQ